MGAILLIINFVLAPHKPYKEKKTPFECGYHSFLAQNRSQFTVSFFLFGFGFLIFDLEIVSIFPVTVTSYFNGGYGITVIVLFALLLTLGFVFELGNNALNIDTKQEKSFVLSSLSSKKLKVFLQGCYKQLIEYPILNKRLILKNLSTQ